MDKFQDAYRNAARVMPDLHMDAEMVKDDLHHYRMKRQRRNYLIVRGCTAATVFLLCGAGTVAAAKNYRDSIIRVNENGVTITASQTEEEKEVFSPVFFLEQLGGVFSIADTGPEEDAGEVQEIKMIEYNSVKEFLEGEHVTVALPAWELFGTKFTREKICVAGGGIDISLHLYNDKCSFSMTQFDNREVESYSTAMTFGGRSSNERSFVNSQGLSYVMFDTLDEKGTVISVSAVISVNGWDLTLTFRGFDRNTIEKVINSIDLSIYSICDIN